MNKEGFLPPHSCKNCGKPLGTVPAELYQGTYTGLCYKCQDAPAIVLKTCPDGALHVSHPPHCPSWRRDRELFYAYADCTDCKGLGRLMVSRSCALGGPYPKNCPKCYDRYRRLRGPIENDCVDKTVAITKRFDGIWNKLPEAERTAEKRQELIAHWTQERNEVFAATNKLLEPLDGPLDKV